ncbi:MAG: hypothetical protein II940_01070 [Methanosarcinaceae archaeon]|nr:hypothetical protein [Methanosarcinaceae archaeon]
MRIMDRSSWACGVNRVRNVLRKHLRISISRKTVPKIMYDSDIKAKMTEKYHPYRKKIKEDFPEKQKRGLPHLMMRQSSIQVHLFSGL